MEHNRDMSNRHQELSWHPEQDGEADGGLGRAN